MKRFISAIICLVLIVALVGCGQKDTGGNGSTTTNQLEAIKKAGVLKVGIEGHLQALHLPR